MFQRGSWGRDGLGRCWRDLGLGARRLVRAAAARVCRPVHVLDIRHIGKEANRLDDVQAGLIGDLDNVLTEYHEPCDEQFRRLVLPVLDRSGRQLGRLVASARRTIDRIRGGQKPRPLLRDTLKALAVNIAGAELASTPHQQSQRDAARLRRHQSLAILAAWQGVSDQRCNWP
jgi:hypothetical protein